MFKDFDISSFKDMKPPSDNSFDTSQEIKELKKIPSNKKFVEYNDNIEKVFKDKANKLNIKDYDGKLVKKLIKESAPIITKLKKHFNRPRPNVIAKKMNIDLKPVYLSSAQTPAYPSGHTTQAFLIAEVLSDKYPKHAKAFNKAAKNISESRLIAKVHYRSDSKMGEKLGKKMYNFIKNKI